MHHPKIKAGRCDSASLLNQNTIPTYDHDAEKAAFNQPLSELKIIINHYGIPTDNINDHDEK